MMLVSLSLAVLILFMPWIIRDLTQEHLDQERADQ